MTQEPVPSRRAAVAAPGETIPWWKTAVVYQIYPRSFADSDGDGIGDLAGIGRRLDYLAWLGVDALWLSPFYRSPMRDGGYDVSDHCDVDPLFGDLAAFDALIGEAHARGLRLIVDFIPNHTSDQHPWFQESSAGRDSTRRDWYFWHDQPNNWRAAFTGGSAWQWHEPTGQYYLHLFLPEQPDLNWRTVEVRDAMHGVLRFWLDRGVDGFRIDAAHCVGKDPTFANDPRCGGGVPLSDFNDQPFSHEILRGIRKLVDSYPGDRLAVGEVNILNPSVIAQYYGRGEELHLAFNFPLLHASWDAVVWRQIGYDTARLFEAAGAWPTWVLANHDNGRARDRYGGSLRRARAAALPLLTLRGTPFIYQGEELGLCNVVVDAQTRVDPGGRDGGRGPLPWEAEYPHGWPGERTWLPFPPDADRLSVASQRTEQGSTLRLYRALLAARRDCDCLRLGDHTELETHPYVLAYQRQYGDDRRVAVVNFAATPGSLHLPGDWRVELDTSGFEGPDDRAGQAFDGHLDAEQGLLLRPEGGSSMPQ
jgi:alpha-glucosidase